MIFSSVPFLENTRDYAAWIRGERNYRRDRTFPPLGRGVFLLTRGDVFFCDRYPGGESICY